MHKRKYVCHHVFYEPRVFFTFLVKVKPFVRNCTQFAFSHVLTMKWTLSISRIRVRRSIRTWFNMWTNDWMSKTWGEEKSRLFLFCRTLYYDVCFFLFQRRQKPLSWTQTPQRSRYLLHRHFLSTRIPWSRIRFFCSAVQIGKICGFFGE